MTNIAIFASGRGSNAKALLGRAASLNNLNIALILTDNKDAGVIDLAKESNINFKVIEKHDLTKNEHESQVLDILKQHNIHWIFLAGYMRLLSGDFISTFYDQELKKNRIINIHPSFLPEFKGLDAYERAFEAKQNYSGISVHFVDAGMDTGPIIIQKKFNKEPTDTLEEFKQRGLSLEHELYPKVLENLDKYLNNTMSPKDIRNFYAF